MGSSQRRKGRAWEQTVVRMLREVMPHESVMRCYQYDQNHGAADVQAGPLHIECKCGKQPNPRAAIAQAEETCADGMMAVAVIKDDRKRPFVVLRLDSFLEIVKNWRLDEAG